MNMNSGEHPDHPTLFGPIATDLQMNANRTLVSDLPTEVKLTS